MKYVLIVNNDISDPVEIKTEQTDPVSAMVEVINKGEEWICENYIPKDDDRYVNGIVYKNNVSKENILGDVSIEYENKKIVNRSHGMMM